MANLRSFTDSKNFKNWLCLLNFLKPYRFRFIGGLLFGLLNGLTSLALLKGVPYVLETVFNNQDAPLWIIVGAIILVPLLMMTRAFTAYTSSYFTNWVGLRIITDIRQKVFEHIQGLSLDFFKRSNVGDLMSRITNDCQQAQSAVTTVISDSITHPFTIVMVAGSLLYRDWKFFLGSIVLAPLCILPIAIYGRKVRRISKLSQENQAEIISCLHENITGIHVVKAFQMETYEKNKFWETGYRQFSYQMRIVRSVNILSPLIEIVAALGVSVALLYAYQQQIPPKIFIELTASIFLLYNPIKSLSKLHTTIQKSLASTDRIFAILDIQPTVVEISSARDLPPIQKQIQLDDVSFKYDSKWILQNVTLTIPHGKTIALVGSSGAGKTTLLNLLPRFYDPVEGRVLIDDMDLREVTLSSIRKKIAMVTQDTILFNDTIFDNIRYGSLNASEEQIIEATHRAYAHDFISQQPYGYQTVVGDKGVKLSGGQKQRLAIARAILKNPSILLLDEATSALDTESERAVQKALDELVQGRTVVVIAHRLSTVQRADLIVVMEKGRIVEQGHHEELMAQGNLYRKFYDLQFKE